MPHCRKREKEENRCSVSVIKKKRSNSLTCKWHHLMNIQSRVKSFPISQLLISNSWLGIRDTYIIYVTINDVTRRIRRSEKKLRRLGRWGATDGGSNWARWMHARLIKSSGMRNRRGIGLSSRRYEREQGRGGWVGVSLAGRQGSKVNWQLR